MAATQQARDRLADYVPVNERLEQFYSDHPGGRVLTAILEHEAEAGFILMRAEVYRTQEDNGPAATGHAFEYRAEGYVNKTSYIENCETSAVGRALALLGYEIKRGIASREEMQKVERHSQDIKVQPINPTVERNTLLKGVMDARKLIADAQGRINGGDFTPADLADLVNGMFNVSDGLESLDIESLRILLKELTLKHDALKAAPSSSGVPQCECGDRTRKTGTKNGKKWAGWLCPNRKCPPQWIDLNAEAEDDEVPF